MPSNINPWSGLGINIISCSLDWSTLQGRNYRVLSATINCSSTYSSILHITVPCWKEFKESFFINNADTFIFTQGQLPQDFYILYYIRYYVCT